MTVLLDTIKFTIIYDNYKIIKFYEIFTPKVGDVKVRTTLIFRTKKNGGSRKVNWWVRNFRPFVDKDTTKKEGTWNPITHLQTYATMDEEENNRNQNHGQCVEQYRFYTCPTTK